MNMQEWLGAWPYTRIDHPEQAPCIIVPDTGRPDCDELQREAYRLTDYRVSSKVAGAIYFMPRN